MEDRNAYQSFQAHTSIDPETGAPHEPLEVRQLTRYCIVLTTGGPHIEINIDYDPEFSEWIGGEFVDTWASDKVTTLNRHDAIVVADLYGICPEC